MQLNDEIRAKYRHYLLTGAWKLVLSAVEG